MSRPLFGTDGYKAVHSELSGDAGVSEHGEEAGTLVL